MLRSMAFVVACAIGLLGFAALGEERKPDGKPIELTLGHTGDVGSIHALTAGEFARRINTRLRGKVVLTVTGGSKLGNEAEMLEKVKTGELAFSLPAPTLIKVDPVFAVFELPYLVLSRAHVKAARSEILKSYFRPAAKKKGLFVLAMWENGFRHITNNVRPVNSPADMKGLKIRVSQGSRLKTIFETYGAAPQEFPFGKPLYEAIKSGQFDGQENPFGNIYTANLHEVQKYLSLTGHQYGLLYPVTGTKTWTKLPRDVRKVIETVALEMQDFSMETGEKLEKTYREKLVLTMQINQVDAISFLAASFPIYKQYATEVPQGKKLIGLLYDRTSFASAGTQW